MSMSSKDSVEVAIRAANIAKTVLELMNPKTPRLARMILEDACRQIAELDDRLISMGGKEQP